MLAKLGLQVWEPDLEEALDLLYNGACRIVALMTLCQIACSGAYQYMRSNLIYCSDLGFLSTAYDYYNHYLLAKKFKKEVKEKGWSMQDVERKVVQQARQQLRDCRYTFLASHSYAKRYQIIASDFNSRRNEGYNLKAGNYVVKALGYQSDSATAFFQRLDCKIKEVEGMMVHRSQQQTRRRPKIPILS
ncbi:hypothetical protein O181_103664 [Austropuccinia psidii MF-1]|uniref:Uncharacterized protein n=1 Tax=Austropuccinia psidii MF-1 TaxID=1389203 RepID=A0A9Q3JLN0_9BASI|nr:hypothetical protein [Austropuccinia psidii MF-1]